MKHISSSRTLLFYLLLWYIFSGITLFLNKYIISYQNGDAMFLGVIQLFCCSASSYLYLTYAPFCLKKLQPSQSKPKSKFYFHILYVNIYKFFVIGALRLSTVALGLIALWFIPVSFAEIIKSSAPVFTVIISILVLKQQTTCLVTLTLLPIMVGLSLCSAFEIHFHPLGFLVALLGNLSECTQNVLSKRVLTSDKYEANQIQLFTSIYSVILQVPYLYYFCYTNFTSLSDLFSNGPLLINYLLCGLSFHFQTLTEYALLNMINPVTHSVANTVKRALLIWLSVIIFGNPVTIMSWLGTFLVISGVFLYNRATKKAHQGDQAKLISTKEEIASV